MREKKKGLILVTLSVCILSIAGLTFNTAIINAKSQDVKKYITTADATYVPVSPTDVSTPPLPNQLEDYAKKGYGKYVKSKGLDYVVRTDLLKSGYSVDTKKSRTSLLSFFTMSDIHITDIQSPAQALAFGKKPGMVAAYSPTIMYTTQVLEAAVESVNDINAAHKLDFGIMLGDAINNAQQNEINMYLDVLTGRMVYPNSDLTKASDTDYTQPFKAEGLDIPWYQVSGNHDHFWSGAFQANDKLLKGITSDTILKIGASPLSNPLYGDDVYPGIIDVSDQYGPIIGDGLKFTEADTIAANSTRSFMNSASLANIFPSGHGINEAPTACYSFEPNANVPIRVIVLDDTADQEHEFKNAMNAAYGYMDTARYNWFSKELAKAKNDKKLVIVALHIPVGVGIWATDSEISDTKLIALIQKYSNVAMVTAGHRHVNSVTAFASPNPSKPEYGFWQVETASLRDFPQQYRIYDIELCDDNVVAIKATNVDTPNTTFANLSRSYAIGISQIVPSMLPPGTPTDPSGAYNAILYKKIPSTIAKELK